MNLCREVLGAYGYTVEAVDSGIGAVVAVRRHVPQLIVIDLQLRDVTGREALGWLHSNPALLMTPVVMVTEGADDRAKEAELPWGIALRRPLTRDAIRRAVGRARQRRP